MRVARRRSVQSFRNSTVRSMLYGESCADPLAKKSLGASAAQSRSAPLTCFTIMNRASFRVHNLHTKGCARADPAERAHKRKLQRHACNAVSKDQAQGTPLMPRGMCMSVQVRRCKRKRKLQNTVLNALLSWHAGAASISYAWDSSSNVELFFTWSRSSADRATRSRPWQCGSASWRSTTPA